MFLAQSEKHNVNDDSEMDTDMVRFVRRFISCSAVNKRRGSDDDRAACARVGVDAGVWVSARKHE